MLRYDNIVKFIELHETELEVYMVFEYLKGGPIADLNIPGEITNIIKIKKIIHEILLGVQYLKRIGIVHRDLKAENLLFENDDDDAQIKLIDFGVSTVIKGKAKMKETLGTVK